MFYGSKDKLSVEHVLWTTHDVVGIIKRVLWCAAPQNKFYAPQNMIFGLISHVLSVRKFSQSKALSAKRSLESDGFAPKPQFWGGKSNSRLLGEC